MFAQYSVLAPAKFSLQVLLYIMFLPSYCSRFLCWYSAVDVHILLHYAMNFLQSFNWGKILWFVGARSFPGHVTIRVLWTLPLKGRAGSGCSRCQHPNLKGTFYTFHNNFQSDIKPYSIRTPLPFLSHKSPSLLCTFCNLKEVFLPLSLSLPTPLQTQLLLCYLCIPAPACLHCWPSIWTLLFYSPRTSLAPPL